MTKLIFLGTGAAIPDATHENTHLALIGRERLVLIDCVGNPVLRMQNQLGIDLPQRLTDLVLTHFHPDHVSGTPSLIMSSWLMGRKQPLPIYGLRHTIERMEKMMELYDWARWPDLYPVTFHAVDENELAPVLSCDEFRILASPVHHLLPTLGLRIEFPASGKVVAYSCDTAPCEITARLAHNAHVLIHEATGASEGHSSAAQAGQVAQEAGAGQLYLIHYPTGNHNHQKLVEQAQSCYAGPVHLAQDWLELDF